jgi:GntR family transcriptional regulator
MDLPLYLQIKQRITESLIGGRWKPGQMIPSEIDLSKEYKVSQGTVRKAIDELSLENILIRRQGKGTFVITHDEEKIQLRFLRLTSSKGQKEKLDNQLLSFKKIKANANIARLLDVQLGTTMIEIKRLLTFSKKPLIFDHILIPASYFRGLTPEKIIQKKGSLYRMYESEYGIQMVKADEKIKAVTATDEAIKHLGVKKTQPLLSIERVSFTYGQKPMEYRLGLCLTENYYYKAELE